MGLEPNELGRKAKLGDKNAKKIYPIRKKGNQLLVTIIFANVAINSSLAIFLDSLTAGIYAALLSTALITIFGEILPQAFISRFALPFAARISGFVKLTMFILSPICKPLAWLLDKWLGDELPKEYARNELIEILEEHVQSQSSDIRREEERIATGALSFGTKQVMEVMTPRSVVYTLKATSNLDSAIMDHLTEKGYSRIPVLEDSNGQVVGLLYAFDLINKDLGNKKVEDIMRKNILIFEETDNLQKALHKLFISKFKLAIVVNKYKEYVGVLSIEDIIEEILDQEIVDEFDEYKNLRKLAEQKAKGK